MPNSRGVLSIVLAAGIALSPMPVLAQALEKVTVTARKRDESIMEAPVVATMASREQMEKFLLSKVSVGRFSSCYS